MTRRLLLLGATVMLLVSALPVVGATEVMLGSRFERLEVESSRVGSSGPTGFFARTPRCPSAPPHER